MMIPAKPTNRNSHRKYKCSNRFKYHPLRNIAAPPKIVAGININFNPTSLFTAARFKPAVTPAPQTVPKAAPHRFNPGQPMEIKVTVILIIAPATKLINGKLGRPNPCRIPAVTCSNPRKMTAGANQVRISTPRFHR